MHGYGYLYSIEVNLTTSYTITTSYYPKYICMSLFLIKSDGSNLTVAAGTFNIKYSSGDSMTSDGGGNSVGFGGSTLYYGFGAGIRFSNLPTNILNINWLIPTSMYSFFTGFSSINREANIYLVF